MVTVNTNGKTIAINIDIKNINICCGCIDSIPGIPPTPIEFARTPVDTENIPATAEPIIPHINGNLYFILTPNNAGSVTPK